MSLSYCGTVEIGGLGVASVVISDIESSNWHGTVRGLKPIRSWTPGPVSVLLRDGPLAGCTTSAVIGVELGEVVLQGTASFETDHPAAPPG
jgi:hypothetical protein